MSEPGETKNEPRAPLCGILVVNKPGGMTSRRVVDRVQKLTRPAKVGHAGTLDPLATGVLVVAIGAATRLIEYVQAGAKEYHAVFLLGVSSPTDDSDSETTPCDDASIPTLAEIEAMLPEFIGVISQRPPEFSAIKVAGRRAYDLARRGEEVNLAARPVEIYSLRVKDFEYPTLKIEIHCGSGTYVRSLGRDLAIRLGTRAVMTSLKRSAIGKYSLTDAIPYEEIDAESIAAHLLPMETAVAELPQIVVSDIEVNDLLCGRAIARDNAISEVTMAAMSTNGRLIAILEAKTDSHWKPAKCFPPV